MKIMTKAEEPASTLSLLALSIVDIKVVSKQNGENTSALGDLQGIFFFFRLKSATYFQGTGEQALFSLLSPSHWRVSLGLSIIFSTQEPAGPSKEHFGT